MLQKEVVTSREAISMLQQVELGASPFFNGLNGPAPFVGAPAIAGLIKLWRAGEVSSPSEARTFEVMGYGMTTREDWNDFVDAVVMDPGWAEVLLDRQSDLLEARNGLGEPPLVYLSIEFFGLGPIAWLLNREADINATDQLGGSALLYALTLYRRPLADYLMVRGASLEFSGFVYRSVADLAAMAESVDWKAYLTSLPIVRAGQETWFSGGQRKICTGQWV